MPDPYRGFRFPAEIIAHAVWLYHGFSLSLRDVETILAERGIVVSYESIRAWSLRFGRAFANALKRRRPPHHSPRRREDCRSTLGGRDKLTTISLRGNAPMPPKYKLFPVESNVNDS